MRLEQPFALSEIEHLLGRVVPDTRNVQFFDQGRIPDEAFSGWSLTSEGEPRRELHRDRVHDLLAAGATMVLNGVERHAAWAQALCQEVAAFTGLATLSNAYLSFGGVGSFGPHWDTHDVMVLQLVGRKRWRVCAPTFELPLPLHTSARSGHRCPEETQLEVTLEPGDLLYLPRGFWHDVTPLAEPSLHLSVGLYAPSVLDLLLWLSHRELAADLRARRSAVDEATATGDLAALIETLKLQLREPGLLMRYRQFHA